VDELDREYEGRDLPVGEHWGGYRVQPETWEFWRHDVNRLHDRERYSRDTDGWLDERLAP
jgi:pyridoxamine 5'-phosphate oxidase